MLISDKITSTIKAAGLNLLRAGCRRLDPSARPQPYPPQHIFLLRTHAIGDVLLTTPVLRALKQAWPQTRLTMLTGDKSRPVLEGNPHLDGILSFPESWWFEKRWTEIWRLTSSCRRLAKDALILCHASPVIHFWGRLIQAPIRVGFDSDGSAVCLTHRVPLNLQGERYLGDVNLDLVRALGVPAENAALEIALSAAELAAGAGLLPRTGDRQWFVGVAPGGGQNPLEQISVKQWPVSHYVQLLRDLLAHHPVAVVLLGDRHDAQIDAIAQSLPVPAGKLINLKGRTSLRQLAAVIKHLDLLITNDSSPMHLAVALETPVVALFGPTAAKALFPAGPSRVALQSTAGCSPCYPFGRFPGCPAPICMAALAVTRVYQAVTELLNRLKK